MPSLPSRRRVPDPPLPLGFCHWGIALFFVSGAPLQYKTGEDRQIMGDGHRSNGCVFAIDG
jgi:hypothetical protein